MQEAGLMNFLRTILIILIIYYAFKLFARYIAPLLLKRYIHKMQNKGQQNYNNQHQNTHVKEGETIIDKKPKNNNQSNNSVGEYVDYEEID